MDGVSVFDTELPLAQLLPTDDGAPIIFGIRRPPQLNVDVSKLSASQDSFWSAAHESLAPERSDPTPMVLSPPPEAEAAAAAAAAAEAEAEAAVAAAARAEAEAEAAAKELSDAKLQRSLTDAELTARFGPAAEIVVPRASTDEPLGISVEYDEVTRPRPQCARARAAVVWRVHAEGWEGPR